MKKFLLAVALFLPCFGFSQSNQSLTDADKQYGLSLLWSNAKFYFANFSGSNINWDSTYQAFIPKVSATKDLRAYYDTLTRFYALLKDGHSNVYLPDSMYKRIKNPAIRTRLIENKVIITKLLNDSLKSMGVEVGDEIVQIDGVDAIEYGRKNVEPFVSASTKQDEINRTYDYELLYGDKNTPVKLKLKKKDGKTTDVSLSRKMKKLNFGQDYGFKVTPENIGILTINSFYVDNYDHLFDSLYPAILKTKALVIDVRENGGGSTEQGAYVISHLIDKPSLGSKWRTRQITAAMVSWQWQPAWYDAEAFTVDPVVGKRYLNPVVVLTSARTFSAAEDFVVMYDNTKRGIKIGQPTGGSTGNPLSFKLPGGGNARICTKHDYYPDGKEFVGVGIKPDIEVDETIDGIRSGTDPVMNKAIDYLSQKIK